MNTKKPEVWLPIPLDTRYEISNHGRVRKFTTFKKIGTRVRVLRLSKTATGYLYVSLQAKGGIRTGVPVHRLVAEAFVDGFRPGLEVDHIDGNKQNPYFENLEWVTSSENHMRARAKQAAEQSRRSFSDDEISQMRKCSEIGLSLSQISRAFGIGTDYLSRIISGERRKT